MKLSRSLGDLLLVQTGWFVCVLSGAAGSPWIGPAGAAVAIAAHLAWTQRGERGAELRLIALLGLLGIALDALQVRIGTLRFPATQAGVLGLPPWFLALWLMFPILFRSALAWLRTRPWLAAGLALVGGPLSYRGGAALGAIELGDPEWAALVSIAVVWAFYLPIALAVTSRAVHRANAARQRCAG